MRVLTGIRAVEDLATNVDNITTISVPTVPGLSIASLSVVTVVRSVGGVTSAAVCTTRGPLGITANGIATDSVSTISSRVYREEVSR